MTWDHVENNEWLDTLSETERAVVDHLGEQPHHLLAGHSDIIFLKWPVGGNQSAVPIKIELSKDRITTTCASSLTDLKQLAETSKDAHPALAFAKILREISRPWADSLATVRDDTYRLHQQVLAPGPTDDVGRQGILEAVLKVARLAVQYEACVRVCDNLLEGDRGAFRDNDETAWPRATEHLGRARDQFERGEARLRESRGILEALEARLLLEETERTNRLLTRASIWFLPGALIVGAFGMNLGLPLPNGNRNLNWPFWVVGCLIVVISFSLTFIVGRISGTSRRKRGNAAAAVVNSTIPQREQAHQ